MDPRAELLRAWEAWDDWCARYSKLYRDAARRNHMPPRKAVAEIGRQGEKPTGDMEDACRAVAQQYGLTSTELRYRLESARRAGLTREQALTKVLNGGQSVPEQEHQVRAGAG